MKKTKNLLDGMKIAILLSDGFEEVEMTKPREALINAGATTFLITPKGKKVKSWQHDKWGKYFKVNKHLKNANPKDFDGILLPGGVMNPDKLRTDKYAVKFVDYFLKNKKPIAAICHGPWTLIETNKIKGVKLTSYHSIKSDLINAGAKWINKKVVVDKNLVTSRSPKDLPAFNKELIKLFTK
jgi:protease I